jgi:hypothetical protein
MALRAARWPVVSELQGNAEEKAGVFTASSTASFTHARTPALPPLSFYSGTQHPRGVFEAIAEQLANRITARHITTWHRCSG